jgi:hypothetical protein
VRRPLGRLAAVVAAGALITFAAAPAALADEPTSPATTTSESTESEVTTTTTTTAESPATSTTKSTETTSSTTTSGPASTTSTSADTTESSKPTETSSSSTSGKPEEPPYQDDTAYGIDLGDGYGAVIIACAAGEPTGVSSPDFDILDGPYQEEQDGRYWDYAVQLHDGLTFANDDISADWTCGTPGGGATGGGAVPAVPGSGDAAAWQASNGGKAQVGYAPKTGVETGFGGTAQG